MKEYLIAYRYTTIGKERGFGRSIYKAPKVSGADIVRIESDLEQSLKCAVVSVMSVQELDADDEKIFSEIQN